MPFGLWSAIGARLGAQSNATSWWLGDWLAFGQTKYGRRYKHAIAATGLDYQTLRNYAVVARRFEITRRRADLTFQHHAEVCALNDCDQDLWLDRAAAAGWSRNELRRQLRRGREPKRLTLHVVRITVDADRAARWARAAQTAGREPEDWIVTVLDAAARDTVD